MNTYFAAHTVNWLKPIRCNVLFFFLRCLSDSFVLIFQEFFAFLPKFVDIRHIYRFYNRRCAELEWIFCDPFLEL